MYECVSYKPVIRKVHFELTIVSSVCVRILSVCVHIAVKKCTQGLSILGNNNQFVTINFMR